MLDLSSLQKAIGSLDSLLLRVRDDAFMAGLDEVLQKGLRAGVIQNFEFTFELCWKFIQRWIRLNRSPEDAEPLVRKDLFRMAARYGLVSDPTLWFDYAEARNLTSHTYDENRAQEVYNVAVGFIDEARYLLAQLEKTND
ncbi:nucleotidyltransferase substrate binding protein [Trichloromonas sp.]|uniref:nucleotidyltransferase substrate binding protein n=1 Tax=Trichloromonas sp. TaxID=3069249 RepID=UPI003D81A09A